MATSTSTNTRRAERERRDLEVRKRYKDKWGKWWEGTKKKATSDYVNE